MAVVQDARLDDDRFVRASDSCVPMIAALNLISLSKSPQPFRSGCRGRA